MVIEPGTHTPQILKMYDFHSIRRYIEGVPVCPELGIFSDLTKNKLDNINNRVNIKISEKICIIAKSNIESNNIY